MQKEEAINRRAMNDQRRIKWDMKYDIEYNGTDGIGSVPFESWSLRPNRAERSHTLAGLIGQAQIKLTLQ